jgi:hypothetical protein
MFQNGFPLSPDAVVPKDEETFAIRRSVIITYDNWPAELAKTRLWKLAFTPSGPLVYGFNRSFAVEKGL